MSNEVGQNVSVLLTAKQAGVYLNLSENMVRKLAYNGSLPYLKMGTTLRFLLSDLDEYVTRSRISSKKIG